jgi:glycosyltransferase involved in cell wall biosynthesis
MTTTSDSKLSLTTSVVIPIYNAAPFLEEAVESVVRERDSGVKEILLVEDGSCDNSLSVARTLQQKYAGLIQLYRHPNGENRGAGASRNLGIRNATGDLICFLDADDYWLPGRLDAAVEILKAKSEVDGVYDLAKFTYENKAAKRKFKGIPDPIGVTQVVDPENLFWELIDRRQDSWHTNCIVLRKHCFRKIGDFDEDLILGQDKALWLRMAARCVLVRNPECKSVAVIRRHDKNRWNIGTETRKRRIEIECNIFLAHHRWMLRYPLEREKRIAILKQLMRLLIYLGRFAQAWDICNRHKMKWIFRHGWQFGVPGPRTLYCGIEYLLKSLISCGMPTKVYTGHKNRHHSKLSNIKQ